MSFTTTTPYMSLMLPIPGEELGPQYATDNNNAFKLIDSHNHTPGQGVPIVSAAININADLSFNSFNITNLRSSRYSNHLAPLSLPADLNIVYVNNNELFFNDGIGNQVQLTLGGSVDTSGSGNITGMGSTTASVVYTNINKTFTFYSDTNTPAFIKTGPISFSNNIVSPNFITLVPNASISSDYTWTLPATQSNTSNILQIDSTGQISYQNAQNFFLFSGFIMAFGGSIAPPGWLLCDGSAMSRTTFSQLFASIGSNYGAGDGSTTFNIPDLRGQFLRGVSGSSGVDPDASSRTALRSGGNSGNNVGSVQDSVFGSHNHSQNPHTHTLQYDNPTNTGGNNLTGWIPNTGTIGVFNTDPTTATNNATGGNETRPTNVYVTYIIKI